MEGDCNIWQHGTTCPQILAYLFSIIAQNSQNVSKIGQFSVVKVQFACEPAGDSM